MESDSHCVMHQILYEDVESKTDQLFVICAQEYHHGVKRQTNAIIGYEICSMVSRRILNDEEQRGKGTESVHHKRSCI